MWGDEISSQDKWGLLQKIMVGIIHASEIWWYDNFLGGNVGILWWKWD